MSERRKCFIIQPLTDKYKQRCEETYKPAIGKADLVPYRADEDYDAKKLKIEAIKEEIKKSAVCLAEISEDNPNVWYELGFADGHDIPIVLICEREKRDKLPFDVNQKDTYFYGTGSQGDWKRLGEEIEKRLRKAVSGRKSVKKDSAADELVKGELTILAFLYYNPGMSNSDGGVSSLIDTMKILELSQEDINNASLRLKFKNMIEVSAPFKHEEPYCSLTQKGRAWCSSNEKQLRSHYSRIQDFLSAL